METAAPAVARTARVSPRTLETIARTVGAVANGHSGRYALTCIQFSADRETLTATATDGIRIHTAEFVADYDPGRQGDGGGAAVAVIPADEFAAAVKRIRAAGDETPVSVAIDNDGNVEIGSERFPDANSRGRFPDYRAHGITGSPDERYTAATGNPRELAARCRAAAAEYRAKVRTAAADAAAAAYAAGLKRTSAETARRILDARRSIDRRFQLAPDAPSVDPALMAEAITAAARYGKPTVHTSTDRTLPVYVTAGGFWAVLMPMMDD